jgi:peptidyl-prolyl cis-trans isomerase SurA
MSRPFRARWASGLGALIVFVAADAQATVVERVVAVVGEQAVLLSQLRERARPFLTRLDQQPTDAAQRAAATSQLYAQLIQRLVEEELEQKAANRANITVTAREIDDALGRIAQQNGVTVDRVIEEATKSGLTEQSYRQEVRRQLLEAKLLNLRIQGRLRITRRGAHGGPHPRREHRPRGPPRRRLRRARPPALHGAQERRPGR